MNNILVVGDLETLNILLYDTDFVDQDKIGEPNRRTVQKIRKYCATTEIQQPYMLCEQH